MRLSTGPTILENSMEIPVKPRNAASISPSKFIFLIIFLILSIQHSFLDWSLSPEFDIIKLAILQSINTCIIYMCISALYTCKFNHDVAQFIIKLSVSSIDWEAFLLLWESFIFLLKCFSFSLVYLSIGVLLLITTDTEILVLVCCFCF